MGNTKSVILPQETKPMSQQCSQSHSGEINSQQAQLPGPLLPYSNEHPSGTGVSPYFTEGGQALKLRYCKAEYSSNEVPLQIRPVA